MPAVGVIHVVDVQLFAQHFADHLEQVAHAHGLVTRNNDILVFKFRVKHGKSRCRGIVHVHVFAQGRGCAVVGNGPFGQRLVHKAVDGVATVRTRAVQRAVTQNGVRQVVHGLIVFNIQLASLLAATVKTARLAVHIQRTGKNVALHASLAAGLKHHDVAQHVDARRIHRTVVGLANVGNARVIEDHICTGNGAVDGFFIQNIARKHGLVGAQPG